ncbi:mitochondrial pyruvate carrier 2-like [Dama dama]
MCQGFGGHAQLRSRNEPASTIRHVCIQVSQEAGPRTVFFWAPIMKWGLVCAGLADTARPAEKLSPAQSAVFMATGFIWSRYSLVIIPKNWSLFAVNFFVGTAGASQLFRIWRYNQELKAKANK